MGTGIVSIALALDREPVLSRVLLVIATAIYLALAAIVVARLLAAPAELLAATRSPGALTGVAATAVLGTRFVELGWSGVGIGLLAGAGAAWAVLPARVLPSLPRPAGGDWFLLTVATEGVAALAAAAAVPEHARWLCDVALVFAVAGLLLYPPVVLRLDPRHLLGGAGEHWVVGGSVAISALAFAELIVASRHIGALHGLLGALRALTIVLWVLALAWLIVLLAAEILRPRLGHGLKRWSTVFPLGMYAACSFKAAAATPLSAAADFARVWTWIALAGWVATAAGGVAWLVRSERARLRDHALRQN